jgi:flavodoxin
VTTPDGSLTARRAVLSGGLGTAAVGLFAAACSTPDRPDAPGRVTAPSVGAATPSGAGPRRKPLVAFFSRAGENYFNGGRIDLAVGNTAVVAGLVADLIDVDTYEISASDPYPDDYEATVRRNVQEQDADARPTIAGRLPDLARYDTILLGSGVWNVRAPMIMQTFLEGLDFTGKTVLPFVTYAVSGLGRIADEYARTLAGATVGDGLAIRGEEASGSRGQVQDWLRQNDLIG